MTMRLTDLDLWGRHEIRVRRVLLRALELLAQDADAIGDVPEPTLNRLLYRYMIISSNELNLKDGSGLFDLPVLDGYPVPTGPGPAFSPFERKRPDICCRVVDHSATDPVTGVRELVIEAKRLGDPTPAGWVFNEEYVISGVARFVSEDHRYGSNGASGLMVGYVQSSTFPTVFSEVNGALTANHLPCVKGDSSPLGDGPLAGLNHVLSRLFGHSPFPLGHVWLDLRKTA
jgi:hypothetical protein